MGRQAKLPELTPGQLDPRKIPVGEKHAGPCPFPGCTTRWQGGSAGRRAHLSVVHPGWQARD